MHAYDLGLTPLIHFWAQIYFCLAVIHLFVTAYLSKSLNLSEKSSKMIKIQYTDPKLVSPQPGHVRPAVGALGGRHEVQGGRQGAQGAAPSPGSLGPPWEAPWRSEHRERATLFAVGIWVSYVSSCYVTSCSVCPGSSVALGGGGGGGACCAMQNRYRIGTDWEHIQQTHFPCTHYHK